MTGFGQLWTSWVECLTCGEKYLHVEASPELDDDPEGPPDCPVCGSPLTMVTRTAEL